MIISLKTAKINVLENRGPVNEYLNKQVVCELFLLRKYDKIFSLNIFAGVYLLISKYGLNIIFAGLN